jgi:hypothetical protein
MANILTFLRPFRYDGVSKILVVQSGPLKLVLDSVEVLRSLFAKSTIEGVICEENHGFLTGKEFDQCTIVRWEERFEALKRLRQNHYDVVVVLYSQLGSFNLKLLPYLLRTKSILVFNQNIDYFPLNIWHLSALSQQISGSKSATGLLFWALWRVILTPMAAVFLIGSVARLYSRATFKRLIRVIRCYGLRERR